MIRRSSSVISASTRTCISLSLGFIGSFSFCILHPITGISLISGCQSWSQFHFSLRFIYFNEFCQINKSLICYLKSSYFSPDSNHSSLVPSPSRITLVEASHHQFVYFFIHLLLTIISTAKSLSSVLFTCTTFLSVFVPFFLSLLSAIGSIKT